MFYKPLFLRLILFIVFFTFIVGIYPLAVGEINEKGHKIVPLLAKVYKQENLTDWWGSVKLDGVR